MKKVLSGGEGLRGASPVINGDRSRKFRDRSSGRNKRRGRRGQPEPRPGLPMDEERVVLGESASVAGRTDGGSSTEEESSADESGGPTVDLYI